MNLYHGSHSEISSISADGVFGGLFATANAGSAQAHGGMIYEITSPNPLTDFDLNYALEGAWDAAIALCRGDESRAEAIMSPACESYSMDPEDGWALQRLRGVLARRLGYTSIEMLDEHGATWLCLPGCTVAATDEGAL